MELHSDVRELPSLIEEWVAARVRARPSVVEEAVETNGSESSGVACALQNVEPLLAQTDHCAVRAHALPPRV